MSGVPAALPGLFGNLLWDQCPINRSQGNYWEGPGSPRRGHHAGSTPGGRRAIPLPHLRRKLTERAGLGDRILMSPQGLTVVCKTSKSRTPSSMWEALVSFHSPFTERLTARSAPCSWRHFVVRTFAGFMAVCAFAPTLCSSVHPPLTQQTLSPVLRSLVPLCAPPAPGAAETGSCLRLFASGCISASAFSLAVCVCSLPS